MSFQSQLERLENVAKAIDENCPRDDEGNLLGNWQQIRSDLDKDIAEAKRWIADIESGGEDPDAD